MLDMDAVRYVPTLRWKQAEKEALLHLGEKAKALTTPLVDFLMPQPSAFTKQKRRKSPSELLQESKVIFEKNLPDIAGAIHKYWGTAPIFVDVSFIDAELRAPSLREMLANGASLGNNSIPVVTLGSDKETLEMAVTSNMDKGICLRLFRSNLVAGYDLVRELDLFLTQYKLPPRETDLIIDFKVWDEGCSRLAEILQRIPHLDEWRTLTFLSGSFPTDLSGFSIDLHRIPRSEWLSWKHGVEEGRLLRAPSFGDYTILHPIYKEPVSGANPSASIRYAAQDKWLIMRGQGLRSKGAGYRQYPAHAQLLMQQPEFRGADFSFGDAYIAEKGKNIMTDQTGSTTTWLRAGVNHHLECTANQLSSMGGHKDSP